MTTTLEPPAVRRSRSLCTWAAVLGAGVVGIGAGVATSFLQGALGGSANQLANSGAVWTLVALAAASVVASAAPAPRPAPSVVAGLVALLGEVAGYYGVASPLRHIPTLMSERVLWTAAALVIGPLTGLAAWAVVRRPGTPRVVSIVAVCGVLLGEAVFALSHRSGSAPFAWCELAVGALAAVAALVMSKAPASGRLVAVLAGAVVAAAIYLAYVDPLLL